MKKHYLNYAFLFAAMLTLSWGAHSQCLTSSMPTNDCSYGDAIDDITIDGNTVSNTGCSSGSGYSYFPTPVWNFTLGASLPITLNVGGSTYNQGVTIWLDANGDGQYDAAEVVYSSSSAALTHTGTLTVPATGQTVGTVRMRVMAVYNQVIPATNACTSNQNTYGETEDYEVQLTGGVGNAEATALLEPITSDCGDFQDSVWVRVTNTGSGVLTNVDVITNLSGLTTGTFNNTIASLPAAAVEDVFVTAINSSTGGTLDVEFYLDSPDADQNNDTLRTSVSIIPISMGTDTQVACDSLEWIDGITYYANNSSATDTLTSLLTGCDSIVTLDLTINNFSTSTDVQVACDSLEWIDGVTYYSDNNTATYTLTSVVTGCDSIVTLDLTVNTVNNGLTESNFVLTADADSTTSTFQWIDCDNGNAIISGATFASYTATTNGNYAVIVTENGCSDTSACFNVMGIGVNEVNGQSILIYPNPTSSNFTIELQENNTAKSYTVTTIEGRLVRQGNINSDRIIVELDGEGKGVYLLRLRGGDLDYVYKIIKE